MDRVRTFTLKDFPTKVISKYEMPCFISILQDRFPTLHPVKIVKTKELNRNEEWGETTVRKIKGKDYLVIRIASWLPHPADFLVLLHEYAHAMQWRPEHQEDDEVHSPEWGICEAKLWRFVGLEKGT